MYKIEQIHVSCWKVIGPGLDKEYLFYDEKVAQLVVKMCEELNVFHLEKSKIGRNINNILIF
jgi:hypothetical protein